ncbi:hypothetical protein EJB05_12863, partial [Eragrostis curvula]
MTWNPRSSPHLSSLFARNRSCLRFFVRRFHSQLVVVLVWSQFVSLKRDAGHVTTKNLPGLMKMLRGLSEVISEEEIAALLSESYPDSEQESRRLSSSPSYGLICRIHPPMHAAASSLATLPNEEGASRRTARKHDEEATNLGEHVDLLQKM